MAPSHLSGMEMRSLLFGVLFGLLAVVHSTPVNTVTQDEVYREVVTDGYIIYRHVRSLLTTESPKRNTTVPTSQQPASESEDSESEGNGGSMTALSLPTTLLPRVTDDTDVLLGHEGEHHVTTTPSVSHAQSSTVFPLNNSDFISMSDTQTPDLSGDGPTQTPDGSEDGLTQTPDWSGDGPTQTPDWPGDRPTQTPDGSGDGLIQTPDGSGDGLTQTPDWSGDGPTQTPDWSGDGPTQTLTQTPKKSGDGLTQTPTETPQKSGDENSGAEPPFRVNPAKNPQRLGKENQEVVTEKGSQGHTTPGWIIIVGFIVGLAALVMLCAAIATRDKWNGPKQASQVGTNANSSNQQRELEMETFLHNDKPRENGKAADYTVVPLDDVPENYSSH